MAGRPVAIPRVGAPRGCRASRTARSTRRRSLRTFLWHHRCNAGPREAMMRRRSPGTRAQPTRRQQRRIVVLARSEEHTSELQSLTNLVCRLLLEKKKKKKDKNTPQPKQKP